MSENKIMMIDEFIKKYNTMSSDRLKKELVNGIIKRTYIPYAEKYAICNGIINSCYFKDGIIHIDSVSEYMLYCLKIVENYTYLIIDYNKSVDEFDKLNKENLITIIVNSLPKQEQEEMRMVLDMVEKDVVANNYEIHSFISFQVARFGNIIGTLCNSGLLTLNEYLSDGNVQSNIINIKDKIKGGIDKIFHSK